ncbi:MAG: hypothetical protein ACK4N5_12440 [Myxococcales bacterium]
MSVGNALAMEHDARSPGNEPLVVEKGTLYAYRMFDVADEIDLLEAVKANKQAATRLKLSREFSQFLEMPNPPVAFDLGTRPLALRSGTLSVEMVARLFDHGAVSILLKIPIAPGTTLGDLVSVTDDIYDNPALDTLARAEADALCDSLQNALQNRHKWEGSESYHVVFVEKFRSSPEANDILERENLARLLLGEVSDKHISDRERFDVTKHAFSYFVDDLTVVDWNAAFVYEPSGSRDIPDILEIAAAQLLELRYYDDLLDRELSRIYGLMAKKRGRWASILRSDYATLRRNVMVLMLEIDEFTERVENSLKIIGDFYLARVYRAAVRRFRIPSWHQSVDRKQGLLAQVYALLKGEVDIDRSLLLESTIVILILVEIVMVLRGLL